MQRLEVVLTTSDEVLQLRQQLQQLQAELADLQNKYNRTEYMYRCEVMINLQLQDFCKEQHVVIPRRLFEYSH